MTLPKVTDKLGVTPGKLALIAGLAIVLLIVIVAPLSSSDSAASGEKISARPKPRGVGDPAASSMATSKHSVWPILTREDVQQHNPFHVSALLAPAPTSTEAEQASALPTADVDLVSQSEAEDAAREREELLEELRGDGVNLIVLSEDGQVAKIGERRIRVGDIIRGFRVVEIASDGIELVEHKSE